MSSILIKTNHVETKCLETTLKQNCKSPRKVNYVLIEYTKAKLKLQMVAFAKNDRYDESTPAQRWQGAQQNIAIIIFSINNDDKQSLF